jgi:hypothetical protein
MWISDKRWCTSRSRPHHLLSRVGVASLFLGCSTAVGAVVGGRFRFPLIELLCFGFGFVAAWVGGGCCCFGSDFAPCSSVLIGGFVSVVFLASIFWCPIWFVRSDGIPLLLRQFCVYFVCAYYFFRIVCFLAFGSSLLVQRLSGNRCGLVAVVWFRKSERMWYFLPERVVWFLMC